MAIAEIIDFQQAERSDTETAPISEPVPTVLIRGSTEVGKETIVWTLEAPESPEQICVEGLSMFFSGYLAPKQTSSPYRHAQAQAGDAIVTWKPARKDGKTILERLKDPQSLHVETAEAVYESIHDNPEVAAYSHNNPLFDLDRLHLIAHSMGNHAALRFALQHAEKVDVITNLASVGYGSPSIEELASNISRFWGSVRHELLPAIRNKNIRTDFPGMLQLLRHELSCPTQTLFEGLSCLTQDLGPTSQQAQKLGILIGYIAFEHDVLVPPNIARTSPQVNDYVELEGMGHMAPQKKPEAVVPQVRFQRDRLRAA